MKKIIIILLLSFVVAVGAYADTTTSSPAFTYLFHLYYDNGKLVADRDFKFKYDLVAEDFIAGAGAFKGEVVSIKDKVIGTFKFDPKNGRTSFTKGKISVKGPYFADAGKVNFYNDKDLLLLTIDVSGSSYCNDDGTCNDKVGENHDTCPNDCKAIVTPVTSPGANGAATGGGPNKQALIVLLSIMGLAIAVAIFYIVRLIGEHKAHSAPPVNSPTNPPPTLPANPPTPPMLPTPPTMPNNQNKL